MKRGVLRSAGDGAAMIERDGQRNDGAEVADGVGELVEMGLAEEDGASGGEAADDLGVFSGDAVVDLAGGGGADARSVDVVLDGEGYVVERAAELAGLGLEVELGGLRECGGGEDGDVGVDLGVVDADALKEAWVRAVEVIWPERMRRAASVSERAATSSALGL